VFRLYLYARVRISTHTLHTRPRVQRAPGIPCTLRFRKEGTSHASLGRYASRERRHTSPVIVREGGRSSIPETSMIEPKAAAYSIPRLRGVRRSRAPSPSTRHCERRESNHSFVVPRGGLLRFARMTRIGRGVPDTPACVGYHAPFGPPKILQLAARSGFRSRPCERPFFRSRLTMTDRSVIL
jgi:hypothetical protein